MTCHAKRETMHPNTCTCIYTDVYTCELHVQVPHVYLYELQSKIKDKHVTRIEILASQSLLFNHHIVLYGTAPRVTLIHYWQHVHVHTVYAPCSIGNMYIYSHITVTATRADSQTWLARIYIYEHVHFPAEVNVYLPSSPWSVEAVVHTSLVQRAWNQSRL